MVRRFTDRRILLSVALALAFLVACASTFQGKVQQAGEVQKGLFDVAQVAAIGVYETTWQVWLSQVKAGTLSPADYKTKIVALDQRMDDLAVKVQQGKAAQRALVDALTLLQKGVGTEGSLLSLQGEFIQFVASVITAVEEIRTTSK